jgi:hypothetical protein
MEGVGFEVGRIWFVYKVAFQRFIFQQHFFKAQLNR